MKDIEKLCEDLRRVYEFHGWDFSKQAADAIEQIQGKCRTWETNANHWNAEYRKLQAENERIRSNCYARDAVQAIIDERDRFKAERDAAVEDLRELAREHCTCYACVNDKFNHDKGVCVGCQYEEGTGSQFARISREEAEQHGETETSTAHKNLR